MAAFLLLGGVLAFALYNNAQQVEGAKREAAASELVAATDNLPQALRNMPEAVAVAPGDAASDVPLLDASEPPAVAVPPPQLTPSAASTDAPDLSSPVGGEIAPTLSEFDQRMLEMRNQALASKPLARDFEGDGGRGGAGVAASPGVVPTASALAAMQGGIPMGMPQAPGPEPDPVTTQNMQQQKTAFVGDARGGDQVEYLQARPRAARSPFELSVGTIIPAVLVDGINSDLPGLVCGLVSQNVFDSATGRFLLIPQGARLCGRYDSNVAYGQQGALVVWDSLTFPNGSTLSLGGMQGYDQRGYAGFRDKVDNHIARLAGYGLLTSLFSASLAISQDDGNSQTLSNQEQVSAAVGREVSQLGVEVTRRNLNIQPTIKIRPGYRFVVKVDRAIAFPSPYR
jgi:type IV secretion system protein VirB10